MSFNIPSDMQHINEIETRLNELARRRSRLELEASQLKAALKLRRNLQYRGKACGAYLRLAEVCRFPSRSAGNVGTVAIILCLPATAFTIVFILSHIATGTTYIAVQAGSAAMLALIAILILLLWIPSPADFSSILENNRRFQSNLNDEVTGIQSRLAASLSNVNMIVDESLQLENSVLYQRQRLLSRNWKSLRGIEWENYLMQVCGLLGYEVENTPASGDQGVDLVVSLGPNRVAIQAKGYQGSVGNSAVQQAVAGKGMYRCQSCAVITNSRFTRSAIELANANDCLMISEENFADFVMGKFPLHSLSRTT